MKNVLRRLVSRKKDHTLSSEEREALTHFQAKLEKLQRKAYPSYRSLLWDLYPEFIKMSLNTPLTQDSEYVKKGYKQGVVSQASMQPFQALLTSAKSYPISHDDYDRNYITHPDLRPHEEKLNASHKLFLLDAELLQAMAPMIAELKEPVAACLGSPWRIINVLCWETFPEALDHGPNDWHRDGLPFAVNKVMIYLNGASKEKGTTSLKLEDGQTLSVEGPPGTWLLFKISEILHKGEKPQIGSRIALEIRVIPAFAFDLRPYSAGYNAHYPQYPWHSLF
jgi:hypothetical protein